MQSFKLSKVFVGCDHAALEMKNMILEHLVSLHIQFEDKGTFTSASCDYPDFAQSVCKSVIQEPLSLGILICGTGVGISIAANKVKGIKCGLCFDPYSAEIARKMNHCNVLSFGARVMGIEIAKQIVDNFLTFQPLYDDQSRRRLEMIEKMEQI